MKPIASLLFAFCVLFEACRKAPKLEYSYIQTYCADPWQNGPDEAATVAAVRAYLQAQGLSPTAIRTVMGPTVEQCNACTCKTGVVIYVSDREDKQERYTELRFSVR